MKHDTVDKLINKLADDTKPCRKSSSRFLVSAIISAAIILFVAIVGMRHDLGHALSHTFLVLESIALGGVGILSFYVGWRLFSVQVPISRGLLKAPFIGFTAILLLYFTFGVWQIFESGFISCGAGAPCLITSSLFTLALAGLLTFVSYRFPSSTPGSAIIYLAVGCGSLALLALRFGCANDGIAHILMWHVVPVVLAIALGTYLFCRVFGRS